MQPLSRDELKALSPSELEEYERHLDALYWEKGKGSFRDFCTRVEVPGVPLGAEDSDQFFTEHVTHATHRELLITAIQRLADGSDSDIDGIMCFMPPGSAKSTYLTNVMALSYGQELVNRFARRTRQIARSPEFNKITGTRGWEPFFIVW